MNNDTTQDRQDEATAADIRAGEEKKVWPNKGERCYDCGSDRPGHHTPLCAFADKDDVRDLREVPGTQWWVGSRTYNEATYNAAVKALAEQIAAMARADAETEDQRELELRAEEHAADAITDLQAAAKDALVLTIKGS